MVMVLPLFPVFGFFGFRDFENNHGQPDDDQWQEN
jgi:hypothetical protein